MCGIAGILGIDPELARPAGRRMLAAMRHRGPDGEGVEEVSSSQPDLPPAMLLHTRLAILDLSAAGQQPMADLPPPGGATESRGARANWVVFNGEIFNYRQLQPELAAFGWPCRTRCDTEVLLHAYRVWGQDSVARFRGMFAWCLLDAARGTAWLCRDRLGVKPLYYTRPPGGGLLFASEVRTLLAAGEDLVPRLVDPAALEGFLAQGAVVGLDSIVRGVQLLSPGASLTLDWQGTALANRRYWQIPFGAAGEAGSPPPSRREAVERLGQTLRDAVKLRLISDVPLGLFLSGGIDSGALATVASEVSPEAVRSLSVGFDEAAYDESDAAATVARELGTAHTAIRLSGDEVRHRFDEVLAAVDQPTVDGFNTYMVSYAARQAGLTVALSGVGGDELFGGYDTFCYVPRSARLGAAARWLGPGRRAAAWAARARGGRGGAKLGELLARESDMAQMYLLRRELFLSADRRSLHRLPSGSHPANGAPLAVVAELREQVRGLHPLNQVSALEFSCFLRHMLLRDADVFSMASALEIRTPLLDHVLVEEAAALPALWKRPAAGVSKPLLVEAAGPRLPRVCAAGPKRGFKFPWERWLRGPMRDRARADLSAGHAAWGALGFDRTAPERLLVRFLAGDRDVSGLQILALMVLGDYVVRNQLRVAA